MDNVKDKIENSLNRLTLVNNWIANCDSKSSYILTFFGVVLTIIFTSKIGDEMFSCLNFIYANDITKKTLINFFQLLTVLLFILFSITALYYTYSTLNARINQKIYNQEELVTSSNIFYGSISTKSFKSFNAETKVEAEENYLNDINSQIFINSNIANIKFKNYNFSLKYTVLAFALFLFYIILK